MLRGVFMMQNPTLTGFHAAPCVCRCDGDYFLAASSFEWYPGIPVYHSKDLKNRELYTHVLTEENRFQQIGLPCGVFPRTEENHRHVRGDRMRGRTLSQQLCRLRFLRNDRVIFQPEIRAGDTENLSKKSSAKSSISPHDEQ